MGIVPWGTSGYGLHTGWTPGSGAMSISTGTDGRTFVTARATYAVNGIHDDRQRQRVWLAKEAANNEGPIECEQVSFFNQWSERYTHVFNPLQKADGGSITTHAFVFKHANGSTAIDTRFYFSDLTAGANRWNLHYWRMPVYAQNSPAEIAWDMLVNRVASSSLLPYLDEASWVAVYQNNLARGEEMTFLTRKGEQLARDVKEVWRHTDDWLAIRPSDDASHQGEVTMHALSRWTAQQRTTGLDLESDSVQSWSARIRDDFNVNAINVTFAEKAVAESALNRDVIENYPLSLPANAGEVRMRKTKDDDLSRVLNLDMPLWDSRTYIMGRFNPALWQGEQWEIELELGPLHWNYEVGDILPVTSSKLGLSDATFVVTKKSPRFKTRSASLTLLQLIVTDGTPPHCVKPSGTTRPWLFTPVGLSLLPHLQRIDDDNPRPYDRWWNEDDAWLYNYGQRDAMRILTYDQPQVFDETTNNNFPFLGDPNIDVSRKSTTYDVDSYLDFNAGGFESYYFVFHFDSLPPTGILFSAGGTTGDYLKIGRQSSGQIGYYTNFDGWQTVAKTGFGSVLTVRLDRTTGQGSIGENGTWLTTSLAYTPVGLFTRAWLGRDVRGGAAGYPSRLRAFIAYTSVSTLPDITDGIEEWLLATI